MNIKDFAAGICIWIFILVCFALITGCATGQQIQRVEVPVQVSCVKNYSVPPKPDYETQHLKKTDSEGEKFLALARDYIRAMIYEGVLEAVIEGCNRL